MNKKVYLEDRRDWQLNAPFYLEDHHSPLQQILHREKLALYSLEDEGKMVLDLGCGVGHLAQTMKDMGKTVVALDFAPAMIALGSKRYPGMSFVLATGGELPFKGSTFDVVVSDGVLHHLKAQGILDAGLSEVQRVLKSGGALCVFDRNSSIIGGLVFRFALLGRRLTIALKGYFAGSATRNEQPFGDKELRQFIKAGFALQSRSYVSSVPLFLLIVMANLLHYFLGLRLASRIRAQMAPLAHHLEKSFCFKWFCVEQCAKLRKVG